MRSPTIALWSLMLGVLVLPNVRAEFMPIEIKQVPVARLAENLEARLKDQPKEVQTRFNLARTYAMAFALKAAELPTGDENAGAWFGEVPKGVPFEAKATADPELQKQAAAWLEKAIAAYKQVLELQADHLEARLGLAWCVEHQPNGKQAAIELYRQLIKDAAPMDRRLRGRYMGVPTVTAEATGYLVALLDPQKDAAEIKRLQKQAAEIEKKLARMITPIAIPLRDGLAAADLIDRQATVRFDLDGSGPRQWQWLTRDAAWLVYDHDGQGRITSGLQFFGSVTFWLFWENGYQALASLDDDGNGSLAGKELAHLALWHDRNSNGISDVGEVRPLASYGITALSCRSRHGTDGTLTSAAGVRFRDGTSRPTFDLVLQASPKTEGRNDEEQ